VKALSLTVPSLFQHVGLCSYIDLQGKAAVKLKFWFLETRPQFLLLSVVLAFLGTSIAWHDGDFHIGYAVLAGFGLLLTHISVNTLNDYFDFRSGLDLATRRTPFSGGSGIIPAGLLRPGQVFWLGTSSFLLAVGIGVFFILKSGWLLLPLLLLAAICVLFYTPVILKMPWPEWAAGLGLGVLPILGLYFVQATQYTWHAVIASVPSGILVHNLLLLNEFPDTEADGRAGRRTLPIIIGGSRASLIYSGLTIALYLWIIGWVIAGVMPVFCLISLLTLPFALITQLLLGIGYILAGFI
jgi:1,4-dihydroxy-2-naphthoate octaprenyltransferase